MFLVSGVAAVVTYADWNGDESQSITIEDGNTVSFNVDFFAMRAPMNVKAFLYNASDDLIYTFFNQQITTNEYHASYTINRGMYGTAGSYSVILTGNDAYSSQSHEITLTVTPDVTAPTLTLNGNNPQIMVVGNPYVEAGATAIDNADGNLTSSIAIDSSNVNNGVIGNYTVTYAVSDSTGNIAMLTRTVRVVASGTDVIAPIVTISSPVDGTTYNNITSLRFIATDANLNSCAYSIDNGTTRIPVACASGVLTNIPLIAVNGTNTWIVYATDNAGNEGSDTVSFTIDPSAIDTTAPVINVIVPVEDREYTSDRITFRIITDENATASLRVNNGSLRTMVDAGNNTFTYAITLSNGDYTVTFYAEDATGNEAQESITFSVNKRASSSGGSGSGSSSGGETITLTGLGSETTSSGTGTTPIVLDLTQSTEKPSIFKAILTAIANFFKWLFGIKK